VSQTLFAAKLIAESLPGIWSARPNDVNKRLNDLERLNAGALAEMRTLLLELRPEGIQNAPLIDLLKQLCEAIQARKTIDVALETELPHSLSLDAHVAFYRIAQETLNNISKHAEATEVTVSLRENEEQVELRITDNGRGFDEETTRPGLGLNIMRERAHSIGAELTISSSPGKGTEVVLVYDFIDNTQQE
jgi:signal transduction histidine kinase